MLETPLVGPLKAAWSWILAGGCWIQDRETHELVPLVPNHVQTRVFAAMLRQARAGKPIRVGVPKYRRGGVSTIVEAILWFLCATLERRRAGTFAHSADDTAGIFELAKIIQDHSGQAARQGATFIRFGATRSLYACKTAGARGVKRGSGLTYLHICELAYLQSLGGLDASAIASLLATVADSPSTIIVIEGTGAGPAGEFHRICMDAAAGKSDYELVFLAWHEDSRNVREVPPDWQITPEEHALMAQFGLSDAQVAWRRAKIANSRDLPTFQREYPATLAECFTVQAGLVYGGFNPIDIKQRGHIGKIAIQKDWHRITAWDWGWTEEQPFVVLWIAYNNKHPPRLIVDPSCRGEPGHPGFIEEFSLWARDPKTGKPIDAHQHGLDCLRYAATAFKITGICYVYRAMYLHNGNVLGLTGCVREFYRHCGVEVKSGRGEDLNKYADLLPERYAGHVADRSQPGMITDLHRWGVNRVPKTENRTRLTGQPANVPRLNASQTKDTSGDTRGEIEDGVAWVQALITGDALFFSPKESAIKTIQKKLLVKAADGRDTDPRLSKKEIRALKDLRARRTQSRAVEVN